MDAATINCPGKSNPMLSLGIQMENQILSCAFKSQMHSFSKLVAEVKNIKAFITFVRTCELLEKRVPSHLNHCPIPKEVKGTLAP